VETEVVIAGAGLAGIVTAYELLDRGRRVLLIDKDTRERWGGLAKESFGGVHLIDTPYQRRMGIKDSAELALRDWLACAQFGDGDLWPRRWAERYCHESRAIFEFLDRKKIRFLPVVNWAERGLQIAHNTIPRWHITWGTGWEIIDRCLKALAAHPRRANLEVWFDHEVSGFDVQNGRAVGVYGKRMRDGGEYRVQAPHVVIASGGMCGGDLSKVKANWYAPWGTPPATLLNGAHRYGDGLLQDRVRELGGAVTHLDKQWHYAAGVHHPPTRGPHDGLSLVPPRSALWVNALGRRIRRPHPLIAYADTRHLVAAILQEPGQYSWQILNWKIAIKELAVSGCDYMTAFRFKRKAELVKTVLFGNETLVTRLLADCPDDFVTARSLPELVDQMNARNLYGLRTDGALLEREIRAYDDQIARGPAYHNDEQLRWIANFLAYRGDRIRTCKFQRILDPTARPLIAIREFILSRKSLGGIQTDLDCRVLGTEGRPLPGLYAVGEAAGFGGGGIHGIGSLEGTFLGACVLTGRAAGRAIGREAA
jgi:hypothetical protein